MAIDASPTEQEASRRLLTEDLCSDVFRHLHAIDKPDELRLVKVDREWELGPPGTFADLRVRPLDGPPYFVEIKTGYKTDEVIRRVGRHYGRPTPRLGDADRLIVIVDRCDHPDWDRLRSGLRAAVVPNLALEIWDEERVAHEVEKLFSIRLHAPANEVDLRDLRRAIDQSKSVLAFGGEPDDGRRQIARHALLWHFGFWRLRELRQAGAILPQDDRLIQPGRYEGVVILFADLSSFSSFVRDTRDDHIVRSMLTSFYTKCRYQVINAGGMLYQFVGDEVTALFGIPDRRASYVEDALRTARGLRAIGRSVMHSWQRKIDRAQPSFGVHIGMAFGEIGLVAQRPFDAGRLGAFGDALNIGGRLMHAAGTDEIVVSNSLRELLPADYECEHLQDDQLRNVGAIRCWRLSVPEAPSDVTTPSAQVARA